jgi:hypothetical protein
MRGILQYNIILYNIIKLNNFINLQSMSHFTQLFGAELLTKDGLKSTEEVLGSAKAVGIYFSAHWVLYYYV